MPATGTILLAAALVSFMAEYGSRRAYAAPDYRGELAALDGFGGLDDFVLPRLLELHIDDFVGLALSSSHAAGLVERFGEAARAIGCAPSPRRITSTRTMSRSAIALPV